METDLRANLFFITEMENTIVTEKEYCKLGLYTLCVDV